ncbi:MAG: two-component regulator propeller domain-containing protein [Bacteroidota bacterium]
MGQKYIVRIIFLFFLSFLLTRRGLLAQQLIFNHELGNANDTDPFLSIAEDKYGFIWFTRQLNGLQRYDGRELKSYRHDPSDPNSVADNYIECLAIDPENIFWIGTYGSGLDRFDYAANTFTHFRHNDKDNSSLVNDTITALLADRSGNIWIGTLGGLDLLDKKTGKFVHFINKPGDTASLSYNDVRVIYEDRAGTIWVGCGRPFSNLAQRPEDGGLNRLDKATGKFTRYMHDPSNPGSIADNKVRVLFEDSKGNFWVGTRGDGLQVLDRDKGTFTHYYYDPAHPEKLSRPPQIIYEGIPSDHISVITEDAAGGVLIGAYSQGINYYNPREKKVTHYGYLISDGYEKIIAADTATGLTDSRIFRSFNSSDGLIWLITLSGNVFTIKPPQTFIPSYTLNATLPDVNTIYAEPGGNNLWIGTDKGLFKQDLKTGVQKIWRHDPLNENSLCNDTISSVKADGDGKLWIATANGLCRFDPVSNTFRTIRHDEKNPQSLSSNNLNYLYIDHEKNLWIGTATTGADKLNSNTGVFTNYRYDVNNKNSLSNDYIIGIHEDHEKNIWIATNHGLNKLSTSKTIGNHYLPNFPVTCVFTDAAGIVWASTSNSLYRFDKANNLFRSYTDPNSHEELKGIVNIIEDKEKNLWISTVISIIKINDKRDALKIYGAGNGVHPNTFLFADNFVGQDGKIYLGDGDGYYAFFPNQLTGKDYSPIVTLTGFKLGDTYITPGKNNILKAPIWDTKTIELTYNQNNFSFEFTAVSYMIPGEKKFLFKLDNYDKDWHYIETDHKAYFYNIPPGHYVLHVKAVASNGEWGEKTMEIIISPPWWRTWWAYTFYAILFIVFSFLANRFIRNRILEKEKIKAREKELEHAKEIEKAYNELKLTQAQLIQSEKMASLGELTAGIAHEIQNPLNFVNNFSEVNKELLTEMNAEIDKGNLDEVKLIAKDITDNEEKINHHGRRADAIVKGMLQHSRTSTGQKELTDINVLTDEYLRLSYHGLRAKDKSFNATINTDFETSIGKINIIPQDIGRVLLNLYNNAFYAASLPYKGEFTDPDYKHNPTVWVSTKKTGDKVFISVKDNGPGIPQNIVDKIFQPFFTTKPTGQGTGLGLSLAYDIVKAHGGQINVKTKEGEGTEFIIYLPINL